VCDAVDTPFGVRLLVGDVMDKGPSGVETAADMLCAFRELAQNESKLSCVAERMHAVLAHRADSAEFARALLVTIRDEDGEAEILCCGNPPPLLLRGAQVSFVDALPPSPPLGLFDLGEGWCHPVIVPFRSGDRLLLYTNGVTEACDADGRFYPLPERAAALRHDDPSVFLDALGADLRRHAADRLKDEAALLLVHGDRSDAGEDGGCDRAGHVEDQWCVCPSTESSPSQTPRR
jgi:serine phosphatase RsbU (regulator of sigma subunit)